jgi:membrane fusion protein, heavy metal efflux system
MRTSSIIAIAVIAATAGAFGYRWLAPATGPAPTRQAEKPPEPRLPKRARKS